VMYGPIVLAGKLGAAGLTADTLRAEVLGQAQAQQPDLLVTSNVGCRIFLDNGLRQLGANVLVVHPLVLLAQQLENSSIHRTELC